MKCSRFTPLREAEDCLFQARDILAQARQEELFKDA
jgi:hypothetical protein